MKIASIADIKAKLSAYVQSTSQGPVVVTRNGKAVAAIVPVVDDDDLERLMLSYSPGLKALLTAARRRVRSGQAIPHDQFWRQVATDSQVKSARKSA